MYCAPGRMLYGMMTSRSLRTPLGQILGSVRLSAPLTSRQMNCAPQAASAGIRSAVAVGTSDAHEPDCPSSADAVMVSFALVRAVFAALRRITDGSNSEG